MTDSNTQLPISSKTTKCTWETATHDNILLQGNNNMIDWSTTKYYKNKKYSGFDNVPNDHLSINLQDKFISHEIPGIIANKIYEYSYDKNNKCYRFIPNKNYTHSEIFRICGGNLYGVLAKTDNTIQVTYQPYDHKNEPIITKEFILS